MSAQAGRIRWRTSDARTYDTKALAETAQLAIGIVDAPPMRRPDCGFTLALVVLLGLTLGGVGIVVWQIAIWLRTGNWPMVVVTDIINKPLIRTGWVGVDRLLTMPFDASLSVVMVLAAASLVYWITRSDRRSDG